jgi:hypothetical protein
LLSAPSLRSVWVAFCRYWRRVSVQRRQRATQVMAAPVRARRATAPQRLAKRSSERRNNTKTKIEKADQAGRVSAGSAAISSTCINKRRHHHTVRKDNGSDVRRIRRCMIRKRPQRPLWLGADAPPLRLFYYRPPRSCTILILRSADCGSVVRRDEPDHA